MLKIDYHDNFLVDLETFCDLPYSKVILTSHGDVSMCCHQSIMLGQLDENTGVLDVWRNKIARDVRQDTTDQRLHKVCTSGNSCPFMSMPKEIKKHRVYRKFTYPTILEICLPDTHCNVGGEKPTADNPACIMCKRNWVDPSQPDLTEMLCEKSKPLMPYLKELMVLGIAEPFWKDALFKIYDQLEFYRYKDRIKFHTNTNVICLDEKTIRKFFDRTTWSDIAFSFDAATADTFKKIRRMNVFDSVLRNAKNYIKIREEYGGKKHHKVHIWNNINLLNLDEMTCMVEMAVDIGVDYMIMLPTYNQQGMIGLGELMLCKKNVKLFSEAAAKAKQRAEELGLWLYYAKSFEVAPEENPIEFEMPQELVQISLIS